jgi:L-lactate dehydrogenase complex protein LldG
VITGQERSILAWAPERLLLDHIQPALEDLGLKLVTPADLQSGEQREQVRHIRYGVTGVEAAFASTGSMLVVSGPDTPRAASLLPFRHVALIPFSRLYRTMEEWLAVQREAGKLAELYRSHANVTMITGPSKSADIEMNLTLGVHGPKYVHAILFDDTPVDFTAGYRPSDLFDEDELEDGGFEPEDDAGASGGFDAEE